MDSNLTKLGIVLSIVFALCFLGLISQLFYVLWRRRRLQRPSLSHGGAGHGHHLAVHHSFMPSKEFIYHFFCLKHLSGRIEPNQVTHDPVNEQARDQLDEALKWQLGLHAPISGVLFTIREDVEREVVECEEKLDKGRRKQEIAPAVIVEVVEDDYTTPLETPCDSPLFYTPCPSPPRDVEPTRSPESQESMPKSPPEIQEACRRLPGM